MRSRAKFLVGAVVIIVTLGWLGWVGATESKAYYHTVSELSSLKGSELHQRMRVSGYVKQGSIHDLGNETDFTIQESGKTLPVSYVGTDPLPDTFEGGAQAVVQGKLLPDGHFQAEQVEAKCASKYAPSTTPMQQSGSASSPQAPAAAN